MNATPTLKSFYTAIQEWIDAGTPTANLYRFDVSDGLCVNLGRYIEGEGYNRLGPEYHDLDLEQWRDFIKAGLNGTFPFNSQSGCNWYCTERNKYTNPERLAWIKAQLSV